MIDAGTFYRCKSLTRVELLDGLEKIGTGSFYESGVESVIFPQSVKIVGACAFGYCACLKSALLNEGLEMLGERDSLDRKTYCGYVFYGSALQSIAIPSTLKTIECETFADCK